MKLTPSEDVWLYVLLITTLDDKEIRRTLERRLGAVGMEQLENMRRKGDLAFQALPHVIATANRKAHSA